VTVDFQKQNYSPGDDVKAKVKVRRPDGEALAPGSSIAYSVPIKDQNDRVTTIEEKLLPLDSQGELKIGFAIPAGTTSDVITVALKTYIGFAQEKGTAAPFASSHSVPILKKDEFDVQFSPEWSVSGLLAGGVKNKVYFQVLSTESSAPIEFYSAEVIEVKAGTKRIIVEDIQHVNNGRSSFEFVPEFSEDSSDGFVLYFLNVVKSAGDEGVEFGLPRVDEAQTLSATIHDDSHLNLKFGDTLQLKLNTPGTGTDEANLRIQLLNRDIAVYQGQQSVNLADTATDYSIEFNEELTDKVPNGGILVLRIYDGSPAIDLERLIFLQPPEGSIPEFEVTTDKDAYQPGEKVNLEVSVTPSATMEEEQFYASVTITDLSSFLEVPKHKLMPSLPAMTHLEKDIKQLNGKVCEFDNSADYIDTMFDRTAEPDGSENYEANLDMLLGTQQWRKGKLADLE